MIVYKLIACFVFFMLCVVLSLWFSNTLAETVEIMGVFMTALNNTMMVLQMGLPTGVGGSS